MHHVGDAASPRADEYTEAASVFKLEKIVTRSDVDKGKLRRKPRADSVRNRERLLVAAAQVFSAGGPGASLEAVARAAGVGIGTLYRHFPTREALFQAVYRHEVDELVALASQLSTEAAPLDAVRAWLRACVRMIATKRGMVAALAPVLDASAEIYSDSVTRLHAALTELLDRAIAAGEVRADITSEEVMRVLIALSYSRDQHAWQDGVVHLLDIFVDGLAADASPARR